MKKFLVFALVSSLACADSRFVEGTRTVAGKTAEVLEMPFVAAKSAFNTVTDPEGDFRDVMGQFAAVPGQVYEDTKDLGIAVKDVTVKAGTAVKNATVNAASSVRDVTVRAGQSIKSGATTVQTKTKDFFQSEAMQDVKDVGTQLFVDAPVQAAEGIADVSRTVWGAIVAGAKAFKSGLVG